MSDNTEIAKALAAIKTAAPSPETPLPWSESPGHIEYGLKDADGLHVGSFRFKQDRDYAKVCVNAAPVLAAEVERLQGLLAAARVAVEAIPWQPHTMACGRAGNGCDCYGGRCNNARTEARRYFAAVGE